MVGVKRLYDTASEGVQNPSRKVQRHKESLDSASSPAPSIQKGPSLDTLPTEILHQVLFASYEPNLIHTCCSLYQRLPDYTAYVKSLAILAFSPRKYPWTRTPIPPVKLPSPELKHLFDPEQLQIEVCRSLWLTPAILRVTHLIWLENLVRATILIPGVAQDPRGREIVEERLQSLKHDYRAARHSPGMWLGLTARQCSVSPLDDRDISIDGFWICVYIDGDDAVHGGNMGIQEWSGFLELSRILNCLLANPTDPTAFAFIDHMVDDHMIDYYEPRDLYNRPHRPLTCSHDLMQQAIRRILRDPGTPRDVTSTKLPPSLILYRLLELNSSCTPPAPLTAEMLALAVNKNKPKMVKLLMGHFPRGPGHLSIEDLLQLELNLQPHQRKCYNLIYREIEERNQGDIEQNMAQRLGFADFPALYAARCAVHAMFQPHV